jgi:mono/diheme cytochrome c family protein
LYKSGHRDMDLYRTFTTGLNGTPMPAYGRSLTNEECWDLVDFIQSLSPQRGAIGRLLKEELE